MSVENLATEILPILKECARRRQTIAYSELAKVVGTSAQSLSTPLSFINDQICDPQDAPNLAALVVSKRTGAPGGGYDLEPKSVEFLVWWCAELNKIFAYDWSTVR